MLSTKLAIDKIASYIRNKRVLIRVDLNVPIQNKIIQDDTRIKQSLKTIQFALENGAKNIALISHLGRPNGKINSKDSLKILVEPLSKLLNREVHFLTDCVGSQVIEVRRFLLIKECQNGRWREDISFRKP